MVNRRRVGSSRMRVPETIPEGLHARLRNTPSSLAGERIRKLAGADEEILEQCPEERTVYSGLAGVILATGVMAAFSMTVAIRQALDGDIFVSIFVGLLWGVAVINIDRWLITSASAAGLRVRSLLPRVVLAVFLGIVISQPLVLLIFRAEVASRVTEDHQSEVSAYTGNLVRCNPPPGSGSGSASLPAHCMSFIIHVQTVAVPQIDAKVADLERQRNLTEAAVSADNRQIANLQVQKDDEALGEKGGDHSGVYGIGPVWHAFERDQQTVVVNRNGLQLQADSLNRQIGQLQSRVVLAVNNYNRLTAIRITALTASRKAELAKSDGLLERLEALEEVTDAYPVLLISRWFVTIFLILFDSLPVLVKMMMGLTTYDRILRARLVARLQVAEGEINVGVHASQTRLNLEREEVEAQADMRRARVDLETRIAAANLNAEREATKTRLYDMYRDV
jgi:hypothetical protein